MKKYLIPQISALSIISSAVKQDDGWRFYLNATDPSKEYLVELSEQDDCMMFYQAITVLCGSEEPSSPCERLSDVFVYIDFSGIFDRKPVGRIAELQHKAEYLFRPEGIEIVLDERYPARRYIAFERSASMSRHNVLSFVREDVYEPLRERMMLGMKIVNCQLSKLYAYNGLMFTGGRRKEIQNLLQEKRIVVIDNPKSIVKDADIITVEDDGTDNPVRKYKKCENLSAGFTAQWKKRVRQLQVPIFALNTKGAWTLRFDDIIADALEAGALKAEECPLPEALNNQLEATDTNGVPKEVVAELIRYYLANKQDDTEWVVLPVANFDAYYGNNNLSKKWLAMIPKSIMIRENKHGVCRYKVITVQKSIAFGSIL